MTKTMRILKVILFVVVAVLFLMLVGNLWSEEQDVTEVSTRGVLVHLIRVFSMHWVGANTSICLSLFIRRELFIAITCQRARCRAVLRYILYLMARVIFGEFVCEKQLVDLILVI